MPSLAGSFLVARHILKESNFRQTVVLLLQHNDEGAFGLVVNRPAEVEGLPFPLFAGGPCESEGLLVLHGHRDWLEEPSSVAPGVYMGDATCLKHIQDPAPGHVLRFRMFKGYSGWGAGQLEQELASGAWTVAPASAEFLFGTPPDEMWERLSPSRIPEPSLN